MIIQCPKSQVSEPVSFERLTGIVNSDFEDDRFPREFHYIPLDEQPSLVVGSNRIHFETLGTPEALFTHESNKEKAQFPFWLFALLCWLVATAVFILAVPRTTGQDSSPVFDPSPQASALGSVPSANGSLNTPRVTTRDTRGEAPGNSQERARALLLFYSLLRHSADS